MKNLNNLKTFEKFNLSSKNEEPIFYNKTITIKSKFKCSSTRKEIETKTPDMALFTGI